MKKESDRIELRKRCKARREWAERSFFFFKQKTAYEIGLGIPAEPLFRSISITTILKRRGCLTVPRLTLMSLIKMMLVMVSVAAISKTFGLLRFLLRLSFLAK